MKAHLILPVHITQLQLIYTRICLWSGIVSPSPADFISPPKREIFDAAAVVDRYRGGERFDDAAISGAVILLSGATANLVSSLALLRRVDRGKEREVEVSTVVERQTTPTPPP